MKTFRQFLKEQRMNDAPRGVIFNGNAAYVGKAHLKLLELSDDLIEKITRIGNRYGYWYEGNGGDVASSSPLPNDKKQYEGSFDDDFLKSIKGTPPEFYYVMFSNVDVNKAVDKLTNPKLSIFDSIMSGYTEDKKRRYLYYMRDVSPDANTLKKFLQMVSDDEHDFLEMSKMPATEENSKKFLKTGEMRMWPKNWNEYPYNAGKVAKAANDQRDKYLTSRKQGVYVVGSGHLLGLMQQDKSLKMIGGEKADT